MSRVRHYQRRLFGDIVLTTLPLGAALLVALLFTRLSLASKLEWLLAALACSALLAVRARNRAVRPLHTAANLIAALRAGDTAQRSTHANAEDSFGHILWEVNALADTLREERLRLQETDALLSKIVDTTDLGVFAFDAGGRLRLVNPAGARLMAEPATALLGRTATALRLPTTGATAQIVPLELPGGSGRFEVRRRAFRQGGREHELVSVSDVSRTLRQEERSAWQRLIRVLGHEVNNSLAPIKSIAQTLRDLARRDPTPADLPAELDNGLALIAQRADSLARFLLGYTALAHLPPPRRRSTDLVELVRRAAQLEQRLPISVQTPAHLIATLDPDQIEQAIINLLQNAVDAALPLDATVEVQLARDAAAPNAPIIVRVIDGGQGLLSHENLFVPFFTTKPKGCGIGLVIARQIVEGHGGTVGLENRDGARGCVATIRLPDAPT